MNTLHTLTTDDSLTLWWEKPAGENTSYAVELNGAFVCETDRTHYTFDGLDAATEYAVCVRYGEEELRSTAVTRAKMRRIDVTLPPYCAVGDGSTLNTAALQRAIDDCDENQCVYLPAGVYLTGALRLHSHMAMYLDEGAVLQGTADVADYEPRILSRFEGIERMCYSSLLNLGHLDHKADANCEDVLLYGHGTISGGGYDLAWNTIESERERLKEYIASLGEELSTYENNDTIPGRVRGRLINMSNCRNVRITGLRLQYGPCWNVHMVYSRGITTDHCAIHSVGVWNGDGWDPDSSEDCALFACAFSTHDDAVAIKSGKNPEGNVIARPTRGIRIFDCVSLFGHGMTIGSEMSGGVEDVRIWDCDLGKSAFGIEIKGTKKRGGYVRNVHFANCVVPRVMMHAVSYNDDGEGAPVPPLFTDCAFDNVTFLGRHLNEKGEELPSPAIELEGFDVPGHEIARVAFRRCRIARGTEIRLHRCKEVALELEEIE